MKIQKLLLFAAIFLTGNFAFSQNYFNTKQIIPLFQPFHPNINPNSTDRKVYFDLSEVNNTNGRLDIVGGISEYQMRTPPDTPVVSFYDIDGSLYLNSNDSNFNEQSSTLLLKVLLIHLIII